jgi:hypothetical protein
MSNKAIDKEYLQKQFKNYNKSIVSQKFGQVWAAIPTPAISVSDTPTYYDADQYLMYGGKIIQWTGASTPWGTGGDAITLTEGLFYKITMTLSDAVDPEGTKYELTSITPVVTGGGTSDVIDYTIEVSGTTSAGALKTYQLYKSVNSGPATPVTGSIIDIPKDFLVKNAKTVTVTTNGGVWFKNVWYEYVPGWSYSSSEPNMPSSLPIGYNDGLYKYINSAGEALYSEVDVTDLDAHDSTVDFWPHELLSVVDSEWVSEGSVYKSDYIVGWATSAIISEYDLVVGKKYIDFEINTKDATEPLTGSEHLYLALDDLVSSYTAGAGISITSDNTISINFQYTTLPNPTLLGFDASKFPQAIQYVGTDDAWGTTDGLETGTEIASPKKLQLGGFYKYDSTSTKWVLINTAKEDVDINFNISDFS